MNTSISTKFGYLQNLPIGRKYSWDFVVPNQNSFFGQLLVTENSNRGAQVQLDFGLVQDIKNDIFVLFQFDGEFRKIMQNDQGFMSIVGQHNKILPTGDWIFLDVTEFENILAL